MVNSNFAQLGEISEAIRGVTFSGGEAAPDAFENSLACLTTSGVQEVVNWDSRRFIPRDRLANSKQILQEGDILISTANSKELVGKSCIVDRLPYEATFGAFVTVIRPNKKVLPEYLAFWMKTKEFLDKCYLMSSNTTNISNLRTSELLEFQIPLPPLAEQKRIASLLARADRLRSLRRQARQLADSLLQSVFLEMFGDALIGKNPKIPLVSLETLCKKITDGTHVTPTYIESGVPFVSIKDLTSILGKIDFSNTKFISREEHEKISKLSNVERDDILYTKVGSYGIAQIVDTDREFSIFVSIALLKPDKSKILPKFLEVVMNSSFVKKQADNLVSGIGVPDLHLREIKTFQIPLPPLPLQEEFARVAARVEGLRARQAEAARQAEGLFQSLLAQSFEV